MTKCFIIKYINYDTHDINENLKKVNFNTNMKRVLI